MFYKYNWDTLQYEQTNPYKKRVIVLYSSLVLIIGLVIGLFLYDKFVVVKENYYEVSYRSIVEELDEKPTYNSVYEYIVSLNIKYPDIVFAQAVLESGHFKSNICITNQNLFGMKEATQRPTTCIGQESGHAFYNTWQSSVQDYALFQASFLRKFTEEEYYSYIAQNYAEDTGYVTRVKEIVRSKDKYLNNGNN